MVAAAFLSSAISGENTPEIGGKAPKIETIEGINVVADANSAGKEKIVSFWSPKKAASRINNMKLSHAAGENVEFISICTDSDEALMQQVMKIDGVNADKVYSAGELSSRVFKDYDVEESPRAFRISSEGKILEVI